MPPASVWVEQPMWQLLVRGRSAWWDDHGCPGMPRLLASLQSGPAAGSGAVRRLCAESSGQRDSSKNGFAVGLGGHFLQQQGEVLDMSNPVSVQ